MEIGVVGAGLIVPEFLKTVDAISKVHVKCISGLESDLDNMNRLAKKHHISSVYTDYDQLLNDEIDAVYVAVPNHLHYMFAKKALQSKKHVILEKPFASNYIQAKELVDIASENHVILFEAISNQYLPNYLKTKKLLSELGKVKIVQLNYSQYSRRYDLFKEGTILPVFDPKKSGGALMDLNVYNIHFVLGLFGKPNKISYLANVERGIDVSGVLMMNYDTFQCVCIAAKDCQSPVSINIQGDEGYIHTDVPANVYSSFEFHLNGGQVEKHQHNGDYSRLYHEIVYFADLVSNKNFEKADISNQHSLDVMKILDEARLQVGVEI